MSGFRFGLAAAGGSCQAWQAECLRQLMAAGAEPVIVITPVAIAAPPGRAAGRLQRFYLEHWLRRRSRALDPIPLAELLPGVPVLRPSAGGAAAMRDALRAQALDFILCLAPPESAAAYAATARFGVWFYEHGDPAAPFARPAGLREVAAGDPVTSSALLWLSESGLGELHRGWVKTQSTHPATVDELCFLAADWAARACREIAVSGLPAALPRKAADGPAQVAAKTGDMIAFAMGLPGRLARRAWTKLFLLERWNVAIVDRPVAAIAAPGADFEARWLPAPPRHCFRADPFAIEKDGRLHVLMEEFDYTTGLGRIVARSIGGNEANARDVRVSGIPGDVHCSYPYLVEHEGRIFCIPEQFASGRVDLYEAAAFPTVWEKRVTILEGFPGVDPTLFRYGERWWLFCTRGGRGVDCRLFAWFADSPLGPWHPHALNPLKCDIRSGRPAGCPYLVDGVLHRPAQDSTRTYGGAITINRVSRLTPTAFAEEPVAHLAPRPGGPWPHGLHTLCAVGERTVIDGKRIEASIFALPLKLIEARSAQRRRRLGKGNGKG